MYHHDSYSLLREERDGKKKMHFISPSSGNTYHSSALSSGMRERDRQKKKTGDICISIEESEHQCP